MAESSRRVIGTHNGRFHCDEALACYMLRRLPEYSSAEVIRTRDPRILASCDVVVDVGGIYDPNAHRYDHHQRSFSESMSSLTENRKPWITKLSSAGLVYLHFGRRLLHHIVGQPLSDEDTEDLFDYVYANFVEEIDGVDNGVECFDGTRRYIVSSTISQRIGRLNAPWNSEIQDNDIRFKEAMQLVGKEFTERVIYYRDVWKPAKTIVKKGIDERFNVDQSGEIIVLDTACPWSDHLFVLEKSSDVNDCSIKYVLYKEFDSSKWKVQAVPIAPDSFQSRLALHESWRGVRDEELTKLCGIPGCIFVHSSGFIGGNATFEGALQMAIKSLALQKT